MVKFKMPVQHPGDTQISNFSIRPVLCIFFNIVIISMGRAIQGFHSATVVEMKGFFDFSLLIIIFMLSLLTIQMVLESPTFILRLKNKTGTSLPINF
jgi:uncharacterized Tic20 family protein